MICLLGTRKKVGRPVETPALESLRILYFACEFFFDSNPRYRYNKVVISSFKNKGSQDIAHGNNSKDARKILPVELHKKARRWLAVLDASSSLDGLKSPGLRLEKLVGNRKGQFSIRINDQYRICFIWADKYADSVEVLDYH